MRQAEIERKTKETEIRLRLALDGTGQAEVATGIPFFEHMLALLARHSLVDLQVQAKGDVEVDFHHLVEDVGICLGRALAQALGDKRGIARYGWAVVPMDESLVLAAVDLSGRAYLGYEMGLGKRSVGAFQAELVEEFFRALATSSAATVHLRALAGSNTHHLIEAAYKAFARALKQAVALDPRVSDIPSTKGTL